jgi:serpin B
VDGGNAFAADLYARLAAQGKGNLFFSPGSIETVMAMAYAGAAGNTAQQMAQTLHFSLPADKLSLAFADLLGQLNNPPGKDANQPAYQLVVANALWGQRRYGFKPDFILSLRKSYGAGLIEVDFNQTEEARKTINDWVAQQTRDKIRDLIARDALTTLTRLVLTNAVYFKSNWLEKFPKQATASGPFKLSADKSVDVPMMRLTKSLGYSENADLQMLELPYARDQLSMVLFLPRKVEGVADMGKSLSAANIEKWLKGKKDTPVDVTMPRFTFSSDFMLAETLKAMGMTDAFDAGKADFSGMTPMGKLCIAQVIHKAFVAVDEEGTEAAAATAVVMKGNGGSERPEQPKVFKADHPFVFLIRHNPTGEILFLGRLSNPKGE